MKNWQAVSLLFLMTFIWGGTFSFTKLGLEYYSASFYVTLRFVIALAISLVFFGRYIKYLDKKIAWQGLVLGLIFGGGFLLQTYGLEYTKVTKSAFITGLTVPVTPFVFWLVVRKFIGRWEIAGVILGAAGLSIFTGVRIDSINYGDFLTILSIFFWAFYITYMDVFTKDRKKFRETSLLVMLQFIAAAPLCLIAFFAIESEPVKWVFNTEVIVSLAYNGILASFMVTFMHTAAQKHTTPVKAALIFSLEPVVAGAFAWWIFGELLSQTEYIGAALLLFGVFISQSGGFFEKKFSPGEKRSV